MNITLSFYTIVPAVNAERTAHLDLLTLSVAIDPIIAVKLQERILRYPIVGVIWVEGGGGSKHDLVKTTQILKFWNL